MFDRDGFRGFVSGDWLRGSDMRDGSDMSECLTKVMFSRFALEQHALE